MKTPKKPKSEKFCKKCNHKTWCCNPLCKCHSPASPEGKEQWITPDEFHSHLKEALRPKPQEPAGKDSTRKILEDAIAVLKSSASGGEKKKKYIDVVCIECRNKGVIREDCLEDALPKSEEPQDTGWEREFDEEFVATGAQIEGMKRVEYRQLREHQVDQIKSFIRSLIAKAELAENLRMGIQKVTEVGEAYDRGKQAGREEMKTRTQQEIDALKSMDLTPKSVLTQLESFLAGKDNT